MVCSCSGWLTVTTFAPSLGIFETLNVNVPRLPQILKSLENLELGLTLVYKCGNPGSSFSIQQIFGCLKSLRNKKKDFPLFAHGALDLYSLHRESGSAQFLATL